MIKKNNRADKKLCAPVKFPSELRLDTISKDWVVIATGRAKRPEIFVAEKRKPEKLSLGKCPFCNIATQEKPLLIYSHGKNVPIPEDWTLPEASSRRKKAGQMAKKFLKKWTTIVIPNKYPAFIPGPRLETKQEGEFYQTMQAVGFHEVVVTRNHQKSLGQLKIEDVKEIVDAYQLRYLDLMKKNFVNYVSIFHNHKEGAGASQPHPHSQIITTPLIDVDLKRALFNSETYYKKTKKCIYCEMNKWETETKQRVVFQNKEFLVVCPFASKVAFEVIISPKLHLSFFEKINEEKKWQFAEAFQSALSKLYKGLGDPAYNFYLHTAPCDGKKYPYYHWHWTILPKTSILAGFEIGTRMEISTIEPEKAAEYLRKQ